MCLVAVCIAVVVAFVFVVAMRGRGGDSPPGPRGLPLLGYLPWLDPERPHLTLTRLAREYGKVYGLRLGSVPSVVLSDAATIREALSLGAFNGRAPLYLTHGIMNGNGIICAEGEKWKDQRKFVTSNLRHFGMAKFGQKRCKMEADIKEGVKDLIERLEASSGPVDPEPLLMHTLGNVVFVLVFGKKWREEDEVWRRLRRYQEEGTKLIGVAGPINFLPALRFLPKYRKVIKYIKDGIADTHEVYREILEEYRQSLSGSTAQEPEHFLAAFEREMRTRGEEPGHYTLEQCHYLMADLWGAGVDTTIATLRWFFLYMATHPGFQEEVQREMDEVVGQRSFSLEDVPLLPMLQASVAETQRIRSVTPLGIPHGALEDTYVSGYRIPKGTMIVPLQWAVHMDPVVHKDPEKFEPRRFIGEDGSFQRSADFLPFQTGKRVCLGEEYARMLLFLFGGCVLQKFTLSPDGSPSLEGDVGITLTPKRHKIRFSRRL